jgi:hypothetical protein
MAIIMVLMVFIELPVNFMDFLVILSQSVHRPQPFSSGNP